MAVKIRMRRLGAKKSPFYRIVVADSRAPRDGRFIEEIGYYNPVSQPKMFRVDSDKVKEWISNGAQPSTTCARLFKEYKVFESTGLVAVGVVEKPVEKKEVVAGSKEVEKVEEAKEDVEEVKEAKKEEMVEAEA